MIARLSLWLLVGAFVVPAAAHAQPCDGVVATGEVVLRAQLFDLAVTQDTTVPMWGFALDPDGDPATQECDPSVPGPRIEVPPGQTTLTVRVLNRLPQPVSLVLPGQPLVPAPTFVDADGTVIAGPRPKRNVTARVRSFVAEAPSMGEQVYVFSGLVPGTFLYQSGTDPAVQVQMGLYGPALVRPAPGEVLPGVAFDTEAVVVLSEVDPAFHEAVAGGQYETSAMGYAPRWFLINGHPGGPGGRLEIGASGQRVLLRLLNAGLLPHAPTVDGWRFELVSREGRRPPGSEWRHAVELPAGTTADVLVSPPGPGTWRLYDRRLYLSSGDGAAGGHALDLGVGP